MKSHLSAQDAQDLGDRRPTQEQSLALWEKTKLPGAAGKGARDRLCYMYRPLVESVVLRGYEKRDSPLFDDLVQIGFVGLLEAIDRYDPSVGTVFSGYAWSLVEWEIKAAHGRLKNLVSMPHRQMSLRRKANAIYQNLLAKLGREPSVQEIAEVCQESPGKVSAVMAVHAVSADAAREETGACILDALPTASLSPEEVLEDEQLLDWAFSLLTTLPQKHRDLVVEHLGLDGRDPKTFAAMAEEKGQCRQATSLVFRKSMAKLRRTSVAA